MKWRAILMNNSTKSTVESMTISAELASTIAELKASIASLAGEVQYWLFASSRGVVKSDRWSGYPQSGSLPF